MLGGETRHKFYICFIIVIITEYFLYDIRHTFKMTINKYGDSEKIKKENNRERERERERERRREMRNRKRVRL